MKQQSLYGLVVFVCTILGVVAAGPVVFISAAQASPYTTTESQEQATDQVRDLGENFEQNDAPSMDEETILSQPQDETIMDDKVWEEEEGLEEEPLENIEGLDEMPEENQDSPLPAP
ncbi:hypothetical protein HRM2_02880 [Desulforapulum autotrophicum HRM2]|uniref:Uncharacterized protein n=1 Tax=Desulforapulum autotrophicum (strain ATCC 43914 / DSM 3382 / VKM B-1955 / HRM2) TaxID=177437 RepID=C0QFL4_DESAH|nr:hypothetical protein [Desulforapulum autotrophicum]ACN13410.1 hypothetical protein HRM2_02880 [Desulforapulum autotrophicum HRM2]